MPYRRPFKISIALAAGNEFAVGAIRVHAHHEAARWLASSAKAIAIFRARSTLAVDRIDLMKL